MRCDRICDSVTSLDVMGDRVRCDRMRCDGVTWLQHRPSLLPSPAPTGGTLGSFNSLLSASCMSSFVLGTSNTAMNKTGGKLALRELTF